MMHREKQDRKEKEGKGLMLLFLTQYILLMPLVVSVGMTFTFAIDISFLVAYILLHIVQIALASLANSIL